MILLCFVGSGPSGYFVGFRISSYISQKMGLGRSLQGDEKEKRFKLATQSSRVSNGVNGTSAFNEKKERKSKKVESGESRAFGVSYAGESKGTRKGVSAKRNVKTRNNGERHESLAEGNKGLKLLNFNKKRKSSDAGLITAEERVSDINAGRFNTKSPSKMGKDKRRDNIYEERKTTKKKLHKLEQSSQNASLAGRKNFRQSGFLDNKKAGAHEMTESKKDEGFRNDKMKKSTKSKSIVTKRSEKEQIKVATVSAGRPSKKKVQDKKSTTDDSEGMEEQHKKKRRRIKIDPYDTSNKRLDDVISINSQYP